MRTIGNILWLLLAGIWLALIYAVAGIIMFIFIITIPWAIGAFRMANYALWPFGRAVVPKQDKIPGTCIANVLWFIFAGLWIAVVHAIVGVILCITIIGIPWGIGSFQMIPIALAPLGKEIVDVDDLSAGTAGAIYAPGPRRSSCGRAGAVSGFARWIPGAAGDPVRRSSCQLVPLH